MTLQEIRESVNFRLNKDQAGNTLSTPEFNNILKIVNMEYFKSQMGLDAIYPVQERVKGFQVTQMLTENTRHLLVNRGIKTPPIAVSASGIAELPSDYFTYTEMNFILVYPLDGESKFETVQVEVLSDNDWPSRAGSVLKRPTFEDPVARFISQDNLQVLPKGIKRLNLSYVKYPEQPVYAVTVDQDDNEVYDPANSTELDWPEICHPDITNRIVSYGSDNIRDQFMKQSSENRKHQGE